MKKWQKSSTRSLTKSTKIELLKRVGELLLLSLPLLLISKINLYKVESITASIVGKILSIVGINNILFDTLGLSGRVVPALYVEGYVFGITNSCIGLYSSYLLIVLLIVFYRRMKRLIEFAALGVGALYFVNILRIVAIIVLITRFNIPIWIDNFVWLILSNGAVIIILLFYLND